MNTATWTNALQNRGTLKVVATTDALLDANGMPPAGLQLFVQATATVGALVPDGTGNLNFTLSEIQLAATPLPMFFAGTGEPPECPAGVPRCWQFVTRGTLVDPASSGTFIPPDAVTVTSSFGGSSTATQNNGGIQLR